MKNVQKHFHKMQNQKINILVKESDSFKRYL